MNKKTKSTFDKFFDENKDQKKVFKEEYQKFLLQEILLACIEEDHISVRELAKKAGISPTIVQEIKTGKKTNINLKTFLKMMAVLGKSVIIEDNYTHEQLQLIS